MQTIATSPCDAVYITHIGVLYVNFDSLRSCIRVYTDHIEFMNGGSFPLPVKDIIGRIYSKLRNPTIAKLFRFVGIAETPATV